MSQWGFNDDEPFDESAFGQAWRAAGDDLDFGALYRDNFLDDGALDHLFPVTTSSLAPPQSVFHAHNARAPETIFPPPHDFVSRSDDTQSHPPHRSTNPTASRTTTPPHPAVNHPQGPPQQGLYGHIVDHLFDIPNPPADYPTPTTSDHSAGFFKLEASSSGESEEGDMARTIRRAGVSRPSGLVDLASASSSRNNAEPLHRRGVKRAAESSASRVAKRRAAEPLKVEGIEEIDLAGEAPSAEEELRQQQQREAIRAQEAAREDQVPQRIGQRQCIICMESYTDATVTSCGHFFCHECLTQALIAGEKNSERGIGSCPVCRKPLSRKRKYEVIPIAFMKKDQFAKNQSTRTDILA